MVCCYDGTESSSIFRFAGWLATGKTWKSQGKFHGILVEIGGGGGGQIIFQN